MDLFNPVCGEAFEKGSFFWNKPGSTSGKKESDQETDDECSGLMSALPQPQNRKQQPGFFLDHLGVENEIAVVGLVKHEDGEQVGDKGPVIPGFGLAQEALAQAHQIGHGVW